MKKVIFLFSIAIIFNSVALLATKDEVKLPTCSECAQYWGKRGGVAGFSAALGAEISKGIGDLLYVFDRDEGDKQGQKTEKERNIANDEQISHKFTYCDPIFGGLGAIFGFIIGRLAEKRVVTTNDKKRDELLKNYCMKHYYLYSSLSWCLGAAGSYSLISMPAMLAREWWFTKKV